MAGRGITSVKDLDVYSLSYLLAVDVFRFTLSFPKEELYSLTDQIRRSSRSIAANISEGYAKRHHENLFKHHLTIALGSLAETKTWLEFARNFLYMPEKKFDEFSERYDILGGKIYRLLQNWHTISAKK